ncbi:MAG TPA: hypothetical protein VFN97_05785 [Actinospica sp.]|nr:hypothetical protein [Actinospica sp.]
MTSSPAQGSRPSQSARSTADHRDLQTGLRKLQLRRRPRRELPPLDLRTPSGRRTLPY